MRSKLSTYSLLIFLLALTGGCSQQESSPPSVEKKAPVQSTLPGQTDNTPAKPAYGDAIVEGSIGDATNLIPFLSSDSSSHGIAGLAYNGLIKYDKDLNMVGDLAESWDVSPDGLTITFHLRKNVKWQDGKPFTAEDVMATYRVIIDPKTPTPYAGDFQQVKTAEILDPYTFRVTYGQPFAPGLNSWGAAILPAHVISGTDITKSPLSRQPMGTGPYRLKEWITGQKIVLTSNHDYFEGRPYIDQYVYRIIPDMATMFLELKSGGVDQMGLTPLQYERQTNTPSFQENYRKYRYLSFSYTYLGFNLLDPKFQDKRVRQAIAHAIDKQELIDGVLLGLGKEATGPFKPGTWVYNPNVKKYPYDPEKAKQLLAEAGWKQTNAEGVLVKDGVPFEFTIITNPGNALREKTGVIIQQRLKKIGISVKIRTIEWAAFLKQFIDQKKFEATILAWTIPQDPDLYDVWHSSKTRPGELNFISYQNPELDLLIQSARHTFDRAKQKEIYFKIQEILAEDQPYDFLYVPDALPIISARFHGVQPAPAGISYNFIKWFVPDKLQKYKVLP
ncbi:MAG: peptide-binding protein [Deltaproteobacteria bacterium]|nr:peptide-binding protein [Deltaproteobacteria bacterium]